MQILPTPTWKEQPIKISSITLAGTKRAVCAFLVFHYTTGSGLSWESGCCLSDADIDGSDNALGTRLAGWG